MDISYIGHSFFKLKTKTAVVAIDPFDPASVGIKYPPQEADIVAVSHAHSDHNFLDKISGMKKVISGPGEYEIMGVSIIGISTFHDDKKGAERGRNTIYIIEMDELRVVHLGDLGHKLSEDTIEELGVVDVLMVPVGGVYTIGPTDAGEIVRDIEPAIVIPMHYSVPGLNAEAFGELAKVDDFLSEVALTVERADKLSLKKAEIGEDKKVVVLERKP